MAKLMNGFVAVAIWTTLGPFGDDPARAATAEDEAPTAAQMPALNVPTARPWVMRAEAGIRYRK